MYLCMLLGFEFGHDPLPLGQILRWVGGLLTSKDGDIKAVNPATPVHHSRSFNYLLPIGVILQHNCIESSM